MCVDHRCGLKEYQDFFFYVDSNLITVAATKPSRLLQQRNRTSDVVSLKNNVQLILGLFCVNYLPVCTYSLKIIFPGPLFIKCRLQNKRSSLIIFAISELLVLPENHIAVPRALPFPMPEYNLVS